MPTVYRVLTISIHTCSYTRSFIFWVGKWIVLMIFHLWRRVSVYLPCLSVRTWDEVSHLDLIVLCRGSSSSGGVYQSSLQYPESSIDALVRAAAGSFLPFSSLLLRSIYERRWVTYGVCRLFDTAAELTADGMADVVSPFPT